MKQTPYLLDDEIAPIDELSERTHEALAEQLFRIITESDLSGRVIGLEGKWGAGKTTVVRILGEKLNGFQTGFMFRTDAWAHEGDPLRKLFLLSLIDDLKQSDRTNPATKRELDKIRDEVVSRTSKSEEVHTSLLSPFGKWVSFLTLFVPMGCVIVDKTLDEVTIGFGLPVHWLFVAGAVSAVAPLWAFVGQFFHWLICRSKFKYENRKPFALFDINASRDFHQVVVSESEKDSVAFAESFEKIVGCIGKSLSRLVIVIDNLDRINHNDALKIWSTLQTFVRTKEKQAFPCLWIVIPYTDEGMKALWGHEYRGADDKEKAGVDVGKSFLDKTFQLRFEVPDLLIGDWQSFAEKKAKEVFADFSESDTKLILDVLCWARRNSCDAPSPREIKLYLNQVRLLHDLHSKNGISLASICFYATQRYLCGMSRQVVEESLRAGRITEHSLPLNPTYDSLVEDLCSLLFGVPRNKGVQLLLHGEISKSLSAGDAKRLVELYRIHGEAFVGVLDYCLTRTPSNAAFGYANTIERGLAPLSVRFHEKALFHWKDWLLHKDERIVGNGTCHSIIRFGRVAASDKDLAARTWNHFADAFRDDLLKSNAPPSRWLEKLDEAKREYGVDLQIEYSANMLPVLKRCGDLDVTQRKQFASYLRLPSFAEEQIASEIKSRRDFDSTLPLAFSILVDAGIQAVDSVFMALQQVFSSPGPRSESHYRMIACFDCLRDKELCKRMVVRFLQIRSVWNVLGDPRGAYGTILLAYLTPKYCETDSVQRIVSVLGIPTSFVSHVLARWKVLSASNAEAIYQLTHLCGDFSYLGTLARSPGNALVGEIVRKAIYHNDLQLAKGNGRFGLFASLSTFLSVGECNKLASLFLSSDDIVVELENLPEGSLTTLLPTFLKLAGNMTRPQIARTRPGIERMVLSASKLGWTKAFASPTELVSLLRALEESGSRLSLTGAFCDAFKTWLSQMFEGKDQQSDFATDDFAVLFRFLDADLKEEVAARINHLARRKAFYLRPVAAALVLDYSNHDKWTGGDGEAIVSAIRNAVFGKRKEEVLRLVPILLAGWNSFKPGIQYAATLKKPVEAWLKDAPDNVGKTLRDLCSKLNVRLDSEL